jgi:hypothetical protein
MTTTIQEDTSMAIQILGFTAGPDSGTSGSITTSDSVTLVVGLNNDGSEGVPVTMWWRLSDGSSFDQTVDLQPGEQWFNWSAGPRPAGSYEGGVDVSAEIDFASQAVGSEQIYFDVEGEADGGGASTDSGDTSSEGGGAVSTHDPNDYRLELGTIAMYTEGGDIVHESDEAFSTERVDYWAEVVNTSDQYLGPFEVLFLIDGHDIGWGGTSQEGVAAGETFWAQGATGSLEEGQHELTIRIVSGEPDLFVGSEQSITLTVLPKYSGRSMEEGEEVGREGWSQRMVYITARDYVGVGINGEAYVEFSGPGGKSAERGTVDRGDLTLDNVWVPTTEGNLNVTIQADVAGGMTLTGNSSFEDAEDGIVLGFTQAKRRVAVTITDVEEFRFMLSERGQIGVEFKLFGLKAGGEVEITSEQEWASSHSESTEYEIWEPQEVLDDRAHGTTETR